MITRNNNNVVKPEAEIDRNPSDLDNSVNDLSAGMMISFRSDVSALSFDVEGYRKSVDEEKQKNVARDVKLKGLETEVNAVRAAAKHLQIERTQIPAMFQRITNCEEKVRLWDENVSDRTLGIIQSIANEFRGVLEEAHKNSCELKEEVQYLNDRLEHIERSVGLPTMGRGGLAGRGRSRGGRTSIPSRQDTARIVATRIATSPAIGAYGFPNEDPRLREHFTGTAESHEMRRQLEQEGKGTMLGPGQVQELKRALSISRLEREVESSGEASAVAGIRTLSISNKKLRVDDEEAARFRRPSRSSQRERRTASSHRSASRSSTSSRLSSISRTSESAQSTRMQPISAQQQQGPQNLTAEVTSPETPEQSTDRPDPDEDGFDPNETDAVKSGKCFGKIALIEIF